MSDTKLFPQKFKRLPTRPDIQKQYYTLTEYVE